MTALVAAPSALLVTEHGGPEVPAEILKRLRQISPQLGLRFCPQLDRSHWQTTWAWKDSDPRWQWVREGKTPPESAFDVVGTLPVGCSVDEAAAYLERALKDYPVAEIKALRERMHRWNATDLPKEQVKMVVEATMDDLARSQRQQNPRRQRVDLAHGVLKRA